MNKDLIKKYEDIEKEIEVLTEKLAELAELSRDEIGETVSTQATKQLQKVDKYTKENPWAVAASLSVLGLIAGIVLSKHMMND